MTLVRPNVTITISDGGLGRTNPVGDGVAGLIVQMASAPTGHAFGVAKKYTGFDSLPAELKALDSLINFFALAPGADIWIMPVVTVTYTVADIVNKAHAQAYAKNLLAAAGGDIRFLGIDAVQTHSTLSTAITNAQALAVDDSNGYNPVIIFLPVQYNASLPDLTAGSANRVGVFISEAGRKESGLLLGRLASTPVQRHIGRIKDGGMPITDPMIGTDKIEASGAKIAEVVEKGYITLGTIKGKSGYYYEMQQLATDPSGDFATIANRRVVDKAVLIAYQTYLNELKDEIEIAADGTVAPAVIKHYQGLIENAINTQMTANGNISGAKAYVDPAQDVLTTGIIEVSLSILPLAYADYITVNIGFTTSLE